MAHHMIGDLLSVETAAILTIALVVVGILVVVVRRIALAALERDSGAITAVTSAILGVYGLILGLTLAASWDRFQIAEFSLRDEANAMFALTRLAPTYDDLGDDLQRAVIAYGDTVIANELMVDEESDIHHRPGSEAIREIYSVMERIGDSPEFGDLNSVDPTWVVLIALDNQRGQRIQLSQNALPRPFWVLLIFGAVLSIAGLIVILPSHPKIHFTITLGATALIVLTLALIHNLDRPYFGSYTVDFTEFTQAVDGMRREYGVNPAAPGAAPSAATPVPSS